MSLSLSRLFSAFPLRSTSKIFIVVRSDEEVQSTFCTWHVQSDAHSGFKLYAFIVFEHPAISLRFALVLFSSWT